MKGRTGVSLAGLRIVNTRAKTQARELSDRLSHLGANILEFPTIEIKAAAAGGDLDRKISELENYDWVLFTSTNSVDGFFRRLNALGHDSSFLKKIKAGSIGPGTSRALAVHNIRADIMADDSSGEGLVAALQSATNWEKKKILLPRAEKARSLVPDKLKSWGADLTIVSVYQTIIPENSSTSSIKDIIENRYDCITFTSSSTFENLVKIIGSDSFKIIAPSLKAASIGPATTAMIRSYGIEPLIIAEKHTIEGLVNAIELYYREKRSIS